MKNVTAQGSKDAGGEGYGGGCEPADKEQVWCQSGAGGAGGGGGGAVPSTSTKHSSESGGQPQVRQCNAWNTFRTVSSSLSSIFGRETERVLDWTVVGLVSLGSKYGLW